MTATGGNSSEVFIKCRTLKADTAGWCHTARVVHVALLCLTPVSASHSPGSWHFAERLAAQRPSPRATVDDHLFYN